MFDRYTYMKMLFLSLSCFLFIVGRAPSAFSEGAIHNKLSVCKYNIWLKYYENTIHLEAALASSHMNGSNESVARLSRMSNRTFWCRSQLRCEKWRIPSMNKLQTKITNQLNISDEDIFVKIDSVNNRGENFSDIKAKSKRLAWKISYVVYSTHLTQLYSNMSMCEVVETLPDRNNKVRNVEVMVKPKLSWTGEYVFSKPIIVQRHVSSLTVLVPTEDRPELSLGKCEDAAVLKSSEKYENAVQERSENYEENIFKSR